MIRSATVGSVFDTWSSVMLNVPAVADASRSALAVWSVVVASWVIVVSTSVRRVPMRPLTQIRAPNAMAATTSPMTP